MSPQPPGFALFRFIFAVIRLPASAVQPGMRGLQPQVSPGISLEWQIAWVCSPGM